MILTTHHHSLFFLQIGPLVDGKNDEVKNGRLTVPFQELHQKQIDLVIEELKGLDFYFNILLIWNALITKQLSNKHHFPRCTKLVFVSSQRDVCSHPVYPQPPYTSSRQSQVNKSILYRLSIDYPTSVPGPCGNNINTDI